MRYAFSFCALLLAALPSQATIVTFDTAPGATEASGLPVSASVTFTTSANLLTVSLSNFLDDPTSIAQALSGLWFSISSLQTSGTLTSSTGTERTIAADGTYTDGASGSTGWLLQNGVSGGMQLCVLCAPIGPSHLVIGGTGSNIVYDGANGSIAGNDPHNPFLAEDVTFTIAINGLTSNSYVSQVIFAFGTGPAFVNTVPGGSDDIPPQAIPEPASWALLLSGLAACCVYRIRRRAS